MGTSTQERSTTSSAHVYVVEIYNLPKAINKIETLNGKLEREGLTERFVYSYERVDETLKNGTVESYYKFTLNRPAIKPINGWEFIGKGETLKGAEEPTILTHYHTDDRSYRVKDLHCDKCGTTRNRSKVALLENVDTKEIIQVGGSCLGLYHGLAPLLALLKTVEELDEMMEQYVGSTQTGYSTNSVLAVALQLSEGGRNFIPSSEGKASTKEAVLSYLNQKNSTPADLIKEWADKIRTIKEGISGESTYAENVNALLKVEIVESKHVGLLVSAVKVRQEFPQKVQKEPAKGYIGEVGEKLTNIPAILTKRATFENHYSYYGGLSHIYIFETTDGKELKWSSSVSVDADEGDNVLITVATVKEHSVYAPTGAEQTVILRAKVSRVE